MIYGASVSVTNQVGVIYGASFLDIPRSHTVEPATVYTAVVGMHSTIYQVYDDKLNTEAGCW